MISAVLSSAPARTAAAMASCHACSNASSRLGRVLVIVATPDLPQGGSGDQKPPKRRPWRGTPLGVQRRRISDEEADVRGETRRVRAPAGRGRHELHPGRARGRRLETHRQGVAQREPRHRDHEPYRARRKAADRLKRPKPRKAAEGTRLWDEIAAGLRRHWSPEQIANRLRLDLPDNGDMHASVETIYQAIYLQARGELRQELVKLFVFGVCFINKVPFVRGMRPRVGRGPVSSWSSCAPR